MLGFFVFLIDRGGIVVVWGRGVLWVEVVSGICFFYYSCVLKAIEG